VDECKPLVKIVIEVVGVSRHLGVHHYACRTKLVLAMGGVKMS